RRTILACVSRARVPPMALALEQAVYLHRSGRLESSLSRGAVRLTPSRVVFKGVRFYSITPRARNRYCSHHLRCDRLSSVWIRRVRSKIGDRSAGGRSEEHTSELQSRGHLVCRPLLEKKTYIAASKHRQYY